MTLTGQTGAIYCLAWSLDGQRIASTSAEGTVWIWDVRAGTALERIRLHSRAVHRVQWDPFNGKRLASVGADRRCERSTVGPSSVTVDSRGGAPCLYSWEVGGRGGGEASRFFS